MPVLYEHWRPDLNECFYVGVSWAQENTRPYDMENRNYRHINVQAELREKNIKVEIRVQSFPNFTKEKLENLEILMIAHWRQYIGDRLTNIHPGGGGILVDWDEEMRQRQRDKKIADFESPKGDAIREAIRQANIRRFSSQEARDHQSKKATEQFSCPKAREHHSLQRKKFYETPEGQRSLQIFIKKTAQYFSLPGTLAERGRRISEVLGTLEARAANSYRKKIFYQSEEGINLRSKQKQMKTGELNPSAKISEKIAQQILNFVGTHAACARHFNLSRGIVYNIRTRKTWRHLKPTTGGK